MAITFLNVGVSNPASPRKAKRCEMLVDSGALYSVIPADDLRRLGIRPTSHEEFILANGEVVRRRVGNALFHYRDKIRAAPVVFGDRGIYLLGATTLEAMGMALDPIRRELLPLPMLMMRLDGRLARS
jgi:predicted aspartyl protease